jgi:hypothetical protein
MYMRAQFFASLKATPPALPIKLWAGFIAASAAYLGVPILVAIALQHPTSIEITRDELILTRRWRWKWQIRRQLKTVVKRVRHGLNGVTIEFESNRGWLHKRQWLINLPRRDRAWLASRLSQLLVKPSVGCASAHHG